MIRSIYCSTIAVMEDELKTYSMRELGQRAGAILDEIRESGKPAFITKHGRFIAVVRPLEPGQVEQQVLAGIVRDTG